jgi:hypothetical protein
MAGVKEVLSGYLRVQRGYSRPSSVAIDTCFLCFCEPGFEYRKRVPSYTDLETLQILRMRLKLMFTAPSDSSSCICKKKQNLNMLLSIGGCAFSPNFAQPLHIGAG